MTYGWGLAIIVYVDIRILVVICICCRDRKVYTLCCLICCEIYIVLFDF